MVVREADAVIGRSLSDKGFFEENLLTEVVRYLRKNHGFYPRLFVDIGANIGTHTLQAMRDGCFASGVAVEMDKENFCLLECNVSLNLPARRPLLFNAAVGEKVGNARMERSSDNYGDHRIRGASRSGTDKYGEQDRPTSDVPMTTLDQLEIDHRLKFDASTLLWIDTQGYEGHVLEGAQRIFQRPRGERPIVVLEFWPYGLDRVDGFPRLLRCLEGLGGLRNLRVQDWQNAALLGAKDLIALREELLSDPATGGLGHVDLLWASESG